MSHMVTAAALDGLCGGSIELVVAIPGAHARGEQQRTRFSASYMRGKLDPTRAQYPHNKHSWPQL